jgi:hypothetical protein
MGASRKGLHGGLQMEDKNVGTGRPRHGSHCRPQTFIRTFGAQITTFRGDVKVVAADDPIGVSARCARNGLENPLDLPGYLFHLAEMRKHRKIQARAGGKYN